MTKKNTKKQFSSSGREVTFKLKNSGIKQKEIAKILKTSQQKISFTLKNYSVQSLNSKKHLYGRKLLLLNEGKAVLVKTAENNRKFSAPKLSNLVQEKFSKRVSPKPLRDIRKRRV